MTPNGDRHQSKDPAEIPLTCDGVPVDRRRKAAVHRRWRATGLNPGDTLDYTFDVTNTGDVTITGVMINEDPFDLPGPIAITPPADIDLSPGETQQWTGSYTLDAGRYRRHLRLGR